MKKKKKFSIRVSARVKPILSKNEHRNGSLDWYGNQITFGKKVFKFNSVIKPDEEQAETYQKIVPPLLQAFKKGYDCCLFAYGQTGSGKTHSVLGPPGALTKSSLSECVGYRSPQKWGLFPRAMLELLKMKQMEEGNGMDLRVSGVEVYFETVYDLLNGRKRVNVGTATANKFSGGKKGFEFGNGKVYDRFGGSTPASKSKIKAKSKKFGMTGQREIEINCEKDIAEFSSLIDATRTSHAHVINHRSSRSHCVITCTCSRVSGKSSLVNTFMFIDLAGSERVKKSKVEGIRHKEAAMTNKTLSALGRTIISLSNGKRFVNYRDSVLTILMKRAIGGNCRTHMVITIAQEDRHLDETRSTLLFGERSMTVKNSATVQKTNVGSSVRNLKRRVRELEKEIEFQIKRGDNGGLDKSFPLPTQNSFLRNKQILEEAKSQATKIKQRMNELRGSKKRGKQSSEFKSLESGYKEAMNTIHIHSGIVARMMVSGLYKQPRESYVRKVDELKRTKGELRKLLRMTGKSDPITKPKEYEKQGGLMIKKWQLEFC